MTETVGTEVREIRRVDDIYIRLRPQESDRVEATFSSEGGRKKKRNFDSTSFEWLAENYIIKYGLRDWTWRTIIKGVRNEHLHEIKLQGKLSKIDAKFVHIIWDMVLKLGGITDIDKVPKLTDPDHKDVKLILTMYSLESFLFKRLNESSRLQETHIIDTLGPFAVALTMIIDKIQQKRNDGKLGEFICYSGMSLPTETIKVWKK
tara:strand:- start:257 stop:871 length:615 start_codon:yes stop_codon:yes gene_type:complete